MIVFESVRKFIFGAPPASTPIEVLRGVRNVKNIRAVTPHVNIMPVSVKPLVRIAMHNVEAAPWSSIGNLRSAEEQPLQVPVRPAPARQFDVIIIPIATGVEVFVLPIVDD